MPIVIQYETGSVGPLGSTTPEWEALYQQDAARKDAMVRSIGAGLSDLGRVIREDKRYREQMVAATKQRQFENQMLIDQAAAKQQMAEQEMLLRQQAGQRDEAMLELRQRQQQLIEQKYNENAYLQRLEPYLELAERMPEDRRAEYEAILSAARRTMVRPMTETGRQAALEATFEKLDELASLAKGRKTRQEEFESYIVANPYTGQPQYFGPRDRAPINLSSPEDNPLNISFDSYVRSFDKLVGTIIKDEEGNDVPISPKMAAEMVNSMIAGYVDVQRKLKALQWGAGVSRVPEVATETQEPPAEPAPPQRVTPALDPNVRKAVENTFGRQGLTQPATAPQVPQTATIKDIEAELDRRGQVGARLRAEMTQRLADIEARVSRAIAEHKAGRMTPQELLAIRLAATQQAEALRREAISRLNQPPRSQLSRPMDDDRFSSASWR
jgi:hypothetical protein